MKEILELIGENREFIIAFGLILSILVLSGVTKVMKDDSKKKEEYTAKQISW